MLGLSGISLQGQHGLEVPTKQINKLALRNTEGLILERYTAMSPYCNTSSNIGISIRCLYILVKVDHSMTNNSSFEKYLDGSST